MDQRNEHIANINAKGQPKQLPAWAAYRITTTQSAFNHNKQE